MRHSTSKSKKWLGLVLLTTAAVVLVVQVPLLAEPQYVDEDLRFFYWLYRFVDPTLFEGDPLLGYQFGQLNLGFTTLLFNKVSLLYGALYAIFSQFVSPLIFSKLLIFPLGLIASYYVFRIGERISDPLTGFLLSVTFTLIIAVPYSSVALSTGLPRAFTMPLLLAMLYYMMVDNYLGMVAVLVVSLFYPPTFLTILLTYGLKYAVESFRSRRLALTGKQLVVFLVALSICLLLLLPALTTGLNSVPTAANGEERTTVYSSPLYGYEGRYPLLKPSLLASNGGLLDVGIVGAYSLGFAVLLLPVAAVLRRQFNLLPVPFWYLMLASLIGFAISWLAILLTPSATFHMPSRYTRGTIFITTLILFIVNAPFAIEAGSRYLTRSPGRSGWFVIVISVIGFLAVYLADVSRIATILIGILVGVMIPLIVISHRHSRERVQDNETSTASASQAAISERKPDRVQSFLLTSLLLVPLLFYVQGPDKFYRPQQEMGELVNFIKKLPQDAIIAGYPCFLDDVPLYSQRMVLFSCEIESRDMGMMEEALDAYFAEDEERVLAFCRQYDVDYVVAGDVTFTEQFMGQKYILFEPLNSFLKQKLSGRRTFAVERVPDNAKIFQNQYHFIFPCTADVLASIH